MTALLFDTHVNMCYNIRVDRCFAKKGETMKRVKHILAFIAFIGFFVIAGALGNDDVMIFSNVAYPFAETLRTVAVGAVLMLPAVVTGVINGQE